MKKMISLLLAVAMILCASVSALADSEEDYEILIDEAESHSLDSEDGELDEVLENTDLGTVSFLDVPGNAYYSKPVMWAVDAGITSGTSKESFSPEKICSRAEIVTFLWRAAGRPEPTASSVPFEDVPSNAYYYKPVLWAVENGITSGTSPVTFSPEKACNRAETVTFLWRAAGKPEPLYEEDGFLDVGNDSYYFKATTWAAEQGVTSGTSKELFSPDAKCSRAQVVTFLYRYSC